MSFKAILCQDRAIAFLQQAYAGDRVAHASIFAGSDGVGRFLTARAWAGLLLCMAPVEMEGLWENCGQCDACRLMAAGTHPDFQHVYKELREHTADGKGKAAPVDLPIDVVREFLIAKVGHKPSLSPRRVFVVSEAEKLNIAGQNSLLKILEEPPPECSIILLCTRLEKLLPTIRSRAQVLRFGPIDRTIVMDRLVEGGAASPQARFFAGLAQGSLGAAWGFLNLAQAGADLFTIKQALVAQMARARLEQVPSQVDACLAAGKQLAEAWAQVETTTSKSDLTRRAQKTVVQVYISVWDDVMKGPLGTSQEAIHADQVREIQMLADRHGPAQAAERVALGYEALRRIEAAVNERLVFEWLLLKSCGSGILPDL
ncbi:ATP-binding protein [Planctomycetota bacterium]